MRKRNSFPLGLSLDLLKQLTQPCTVNHHPRRVDQRFRMIQDGCLMGNRRLLVLTGMGSDLLGIEGDLEGLPTHLLNFGQGCRQISEGKTELQRQAQERRRREREDAAPVLPVTYNFQPEHRERLKSLYWDKLGHVTAQQPPDLCLRPKSNEPRMLRQRWTRIGRS